MKIPASVKVGPIKYAVEIIEDLVAEDGDKLFGVIKFTSSRIQINRSTDLNLQYVTLWHEMLHAVEAQMGVDLGEKVVEGLAYNIVDILKKNDL